MFGKKKIKSDLEQIQQKVSTMSEGVKKVIDIIEETQKEAKDTSGKFDKFYGDTIKRLNDMEIWQMTDKDTLEAMTKEKELLKDLYLGMRDKFNEFEKLQIKNKKLFEFILNRIDMDDDSYDELNDIIQERQQQKVSLDN